MEGTYRATIGLEIHAELKTKTKMFCRSKNDPDETRPNVNICPVCLAHPGALPVINGEAVRHVLRVGVALGGRLADYSEFDRKNYFYPDLPKGYQISQYEYPLVAGGSLNGVAITRVHLEEDTASSIHDEMTDATLVDYNRAGVPLMELVTEPDMHTAQEAGAFARELQLLLRYLGVSEANMEKGEMRVEANVSVARGNGRNSTYVEIKNLNSFRIMEKAVAYEIERQKRILEKGATIEKQTLGWDEHKQVTFPQRIKEGSADYRYFPDPDLPSLKITGITGCALEELKGSLPELPSERRTRYATLGIKSEDAELYVRETDFGDFFDEASKKFEADVEGIRLASNYLANDLVKIVRDIAERDSEKKAEIPISAQNFKKIIELLRTNKVSSRSAKDILAVCVASGKDPELVVKERRLFQDVGSERLDVIVSEVVAENKSAFEGYKQGKTAALEYLVGQAMKKVRGAADPNVLRALFQAAE